MADLPAACSNLTPATVLCSEDALYNLFIDIQIFQPWARYSFWIPAPLLFRPPMDIAATLGPTEEPFHAVMKWEMFGWWTHLLF